TVVIASPGLIEEVAGDPSNSYWGLQPSGTIRDVSQVSDDWWQVVEREAVPQDGVNSGSNPAKTRIFERVTPSGTDLVFSEKGTMPNPVPEYGSAHYDSDAFPDHKLALIKPADDT